MRALCTHSIFHGRKKSYDANIEKLPVRAEKPRRNIQLVLERWGVWAKDNSGIDYSSIAAGFKGLLPYTTSSRLSCCDDDGLAVDGCVSRLKSHRYDEWELVIRHYVYNQSKRAIARQQRKTKEQ